MTRFTWLVVGLLVLTFVGVLIAHWVRELPAVQDFPTSYPGQSELPDGVAVDFQAWFAWQNFLNVSFLVRIIRTEWLVRTNQRPAAFWTRNNSGPIRTRNSPKKISRDCGCTSASTRFGY